MSCSLGVLSRPAGVTQAHSQRHAGNRLDEDLLLVEDTVGRGLRGELFGEDLGVLLDILHARHLTR